MKRRPDDEGAYAILYALLMVLLIGLGAIVVDLSISRADRRTNRSVADSAVVAAAGVLGFGGSRPVQACEQAVQIAAANLGIDGVSTDPCDGLLTNSTLVNGACVSTTTARTVAIPLDAGRQLLVTWPVPDGYLIPDLEQRSGIPDDQPASVAQDGLQCERIRVNVEQSRTRGLSAIYGKDDIITASVSTARVVPSTQSGDIPVPLVVLDQHSCNAVDVGGGGKPDDVDGSGLTVRATLDGKYPGGIAIDSDADPSADRKKTEELCTSSTDVTLRVSNNTHVWTLGLPATADSPAQPGMLRTFASTAGRPSRAATAFPAGDCKVPFAAADALLASTSGPPNLCATPSTQLFPRATKFPWVNRYNCVSSTMTCLAVQGVPALPAPRDYVEQWRRFATNKTAGEGPSTFATVLSGPKCVLSGVDGPYTDVYAACDQLDIVGTVMVSGNFVATGDVSITLASCLLLNDNDLTHCLVTPPSIDPATAGADGKNAYIGGTLEMKNSGSFVTRQVFTLLGGKFRASSTGVLSLVAPYGYQLGTSPGTCTPAASRAAQPTSACFTALTVWGGSYAAKTAPSSITAQVKLNVDGTIFLPEQYLQYSGQGSNDQARAQFVLRRLNITGGAQLTMTPDSTRGTNLPPAIGRLIR